MTCWRVGARHRRLRFVLGLVDNNDVSLSSGRGGGRCVLMHDRHGGDVVLEDDDDVMCFVI